MTEPAVIPSDPEPGSSTEGVGTSEGAPPIEPHRGEHAPSSPAPDLPVSPPSTDSPSEWKAPPIASMIHGLDDDTLHHPALQEIEDPKHLARRYVEMQKMIGKKSIPVPGADATADDWNQFYAKLGRPESSDKYSFIEGLDPQVRNQAQVFLRPILDSFHQAGLTDEQATAVATTYLKATADQVEARQRSALEAKELAETTLRQRWGSAYEPKLNAAAEAANTLFGENFDQFQRIQLADGSFLADNPLILELLSALGEANDEGAIHPSGGRATLTPEEAQAELQALMSDPESLAAYMNRDHPQHKAMLDRRLQLRRMANPRGETRNLYDPIGL